MGKSKKPRVKGNVQPASSSRAAEIIATSGQSPIGNLGGFAQFLGGKAFSSAANDRIFPDSAISSGTIEPELVLIFKRLSKRDPTTKLKALEEFEEYLKNEGRDADELVGIMDVWTTRFVKLGIDVDRRVRHATYSCHFIIVTKIKKKIAPYLKEIIAVWIISLFDQSKDVAKIANDAFQEAFPSDKRVGVLMFGQEKILSYITEIILFKTPDTLSDPRFTSKEDMNSKYLRVVTSSYYALAHIINQLEESALAKNYDNLFDNSKFWGNLSNDNSLVRKSCYNLIKVLVNKWPSKVEERLEMFSATYLMRVFNDKDTSVHQDLWDSLLIFTRRFPQSWLIASKKKPMLPKLYNFLRSGAFGSINVSYPSILPLIVHLPQELINFDKKFYEVFFSNFWKGLSSPVIDRFNSSVFLESYSECLVYYIIKLEKNDYERDKHIYLVEKVFFGLIENYLLEFESNAKFQSEQMCSIISTNISSLFSKLKDTEPLKIIFKKLEDLCERVITHGSVPNPGPNAENDYIEFSQRLSHFLSSLMITPEIRQKDCELFTMSLDKFITTTFNDLIATCPISAQDYLFESYSIYLLYAQNPQANESWHNFMQILLGFNDLEKKLECIRLSIIKVSEPKLLGPLIDDQFDEFLIFITNELFSDKIDANVRKLVEDVLELTFLSDVSLLSQKTKLEILGHFSREIDTFAHSYYTVTGNTVISYDSVTSVLRIFTKLCGDAQFMKILLESDLLLISWAIFELTFVKAYESSDSEIIKDIGSLVQDIWNQISNSCRSNHKEDVVFHHISQQIRESLLNIQYAVSPTDFAQRVMKLCTSLYQAERATSREVIASFLLSEKEWRQLSEPLLASPIDSSLSIVDSMIPIIYNGDIHAKNHFETQSTQPVAYDIYGLSAYARLGIFAIELINKIGVSMFFDISDSKDVSFDEKLSTHWVLSELLLLQVMCNDIHHSRKRRHHLWDAIVTEESDYHGFKAFLSDYSTILKNYVKFMMQSTSIDLKSLAEKIKFANSSEQCPIIDLSSFFVYTLRRSNGNYSHYWARTLQILFSTILEVLNVLVVDAEKFLEIIQLEPSDCNLVIKMALISSLRPFLESSKKFKTFQNDLLSKLCELSATDICNTDDSSSNKGLEYLSLLTTTTKRDDEYFLTPRRSIDLVNCIIKWHEDTDSKLLFDPEYTHIQIHISRLFISITSSIHDSQGTHWNFIFQCLQNWFEKIRNLELRYEAIYLFCRLISFNIQYENKPNKIESDDTSNESLCKYFSEFKTILYEKLSHLLFQEKDHQGETFSEQYNKYLDILCEACQDLSKSLLINERNETMRLSEELELTAGNSDEINVQFDKGLISLIMQTQKSDYLNDIYSANTDIFIAHKVFGYLLGWMLVLDHFEFASFKVKSQLVSCLKESNITSNLFTYIFDTLGLSRSNKPYDLLYWSISEFHIEGFEVQHSFDLGIPLLCAHLYYRSLKHIPSIVRIWWSECKKRQLSIAVDSYTEKYFSPVIIQNQLEMLQSEDVKSQLEDDKFSIRIARSSNEVIASFMVDEYVMELSIRMPNNFPLRQAEFSTLERMGTREVADLKWAKLPVQTVVNSQNGNLEVALNLFKNNINLRFRGIEDCPICYSVVSLDDRSLPTKQCSTCKNKFHAACLYKWFRSSNSTSCPLCRRLF
ncbi:13194_t:CDS:10 [Funneliformis geosporum]|nr:13194_t:CDS:10 [Funneliformis geosporum]